REPERCLPVLAKSCYIVRMIHARANVLSLHVLRADAVIIQHGLIHRQHASIRSRHLYEGRYGVDHQAQIAFVLLERLFRSFAVVDVGEQDVPADDSIVGAPKRKPTNLKPSIDAVETPYTFYDLVWLSGIHRIGDDRGGAGQIVGMNGVA